MIYMANNDKKQSLVNVSTMPKSKGKSNYEKALEHYNLQGKSAVQVGKRFNYAPTYSIKRKNGLVEKKKVSIDNPNYLDRVREYLVKRWKNDTQEYSGVYNMTYKLYNSRTKKMESKMTKISVKGTKDYILLEALAEFNKRIKEYRDKYPENDSYTFDENAVSLVPIPYGMGIIVEKQRVETSVSGGQRKVGKNGVRRNMPMRDAFSFFKFSDDKQVWNTNQGKCVFDYLIWKFKGEVGFIRALGKKEDSNEKAEEFLNELFKGNELEEQNPIVQGVSIGQLEKFCDKFSMPMYAYDKTDNLIEYYKCKKAIEKTEQGGRLTLSGGKGALIFTCFDNHFEPVEDKTKRDSMVARATKEVGDGFKSNDVGNKKKKETEKEKKLIVAPTEEEFKELTNDKPDYLSVQNKWALDFFKENDGKLPFPITSKNLYVNDATIERITYDDKIILTKPIDLMVERFYEENTTEGYSGGSTLSITNHIWEQMYPFKFLDATFMSQPNQQVAEALNAENVKYRTHLGRTTEYYDAEMIRDMIQDGKAIAVDITKCYCDAIYNQREKFMVFKGKEVMEAYDKKHLTLGLYFVETDDMTLLHQSNWYSKAILDLAKKENIDFKIVRQIRCVDEDWNWEKVVIDDEGNEVSRVSLDNSNLFKNWCDSVIELTEQDEDFTLTKNVINSITGYLGKTYTKTKEVSLSKNLEEVWTDWLVPKVQNNPNLNVYLNTIESGEDKVYLYGTEKKEKNLSNGLPMYIQLLDWSNMALYNLGKDVGGEVIYRKTDCIVSIGGKIPKNKLEKKICSYSRRFGKYHLEDIEKVLHFNFDLLMNTNRSVETPVLDDEWIDYNQFKSSNDWKDIIKMAIEKGGMMVSGRAGTGKSYIIQEGITAGLLPEDEESRITLTNRAAININGKTIHTAMAIDKFDRTNTKTLNHLKAIPIFVVDEISMLNAMLWNKLMILKEATKAIFIILGDHRQCPPIEGGKEVDYFNHPYSKRLVNNNRCELTQPQRYNGKLWRWLEDFYEKGLVYNDIKRRSLSLEDILYKKNITFRNITRCRINDLCMEHFIKEKNYRALPIYEKCLNEYGADAYIYKGLPVMAIKRNDKMGIFNSEEFWVKEFSSSEQTITLYRDGDENGETLVVLDKEFHLHFVVNYAATTHKSQGATIKKDINIFDWSFMMENRKIGYTAVSRAKNCEQITICDRIVIDGRLSGI